MILVGVLILFTLTNPSMNDFEKYVDNMTQSKIDEKTGLEKATETLKQSSLGSLYKVCARKSNYILFSTYTIEIPGEDKFAYLAFLKVVFIKM